MKTPTTLTVTSLAQLDALVAEHVAGWKRGEAERGQKRHKAYYLYSPQYDDRRWRGSAYAVVWKDGTIGGDIPKFATSSDAVLPYLEKGSCYFKRNYFMGSTEKPDTWFCHFCRWDESDKSQKEGKAYADTLPLAACICLLRAHGVEVNLEIPHAH